MQGEVARPRLEAIHCRGQQPGAHDTAQTDWHRGHTPRITTTCLPEYTSFRPVPPQLPNQLAMTATESHVRAFSPLHRRKSPSENTLSPLQRRVHSPGAAVAVVRLYEDPAKVSADISYAVINQPYLRNQQTREAMTPAPPGAQRPVGRGRQAWGTPVDSPIEASPRTKFIHDRGARGTLTSSIAGLTSC